MDLQSDMAEARREGLAEGEAKGLSKLAEAARRMKRDGLEPEQIAAYTGLSPAEIEGL
jgi:predicted transposase YdaD